MQYGAEIMVKVLKLLSLMLTSIEGYADVVELLIDSGADVNSRDKREYQVLYWT